MNVRILYGLEELRALAPAWNALQPAGLRTPMQDHAWSLSCAETLPDCAEPLTVCVSDASGLRAVAPLQRVGSLAVRHEQSGVRVLQEPTDLLYSDEQALRQLLDALARLGKPLVLGRLFADSATAQTLSTASRPYGLVQLQSGSALPFIPVSEAGNVEAVLSRRLLSDLRRAARKADAIGTVSFEMHSPGSEEEFLPLFEEALQVESAGWKGRAGTALASDAVRREFYRRYGIRAAEDGALRIAFLRIGSQAVAMQFAVQSHRRFWLLKVGYDETFSRCSPGHLLMLETLRFAIEQNLDSYEFLGSAEAWTKRWTPHQRDTIRIESFPLSVGGLVTLTQRSVRRGAGRVARQAAAFNEQLRNLVADRSGRNKEASENS